MVTSEIKGNFLILTIDVSGTPYKSKSALLKAAAKGLDEKQVEASAVATSGGFVRQGKFKYSVNVNLA